MTMSNGNGNGHRHGATDEKVNISTDPISPKSKKIYVSGHQVEKYNQFRGLEPLFFYKIK